ncbi:phosphoribosylglycinamide formyltransferase [Rhodobacterales bacterium HKCCE2091]|nr:phosphoribosylglycinamide formyltransferase [Rhodobacterales bacterium HKCCE2091]
MTVRTAILISGSGSNMETLVRSMTGDHPARPVLVLCNRPDVAGIERAAGLGVPVHVVDHRRFADKAAFEAALDARLRDYQTDLVCLAGFMRILSAGFVEKWPHRILNIHPSLLPKFRGLDTHARALAAGETEHGCTVHEVTPALDDGPILGQARLAVDPDETPEALAHRVLELEHRLYPAVLRRVAAGDRSPLQLD